MKKKTNFYLYYFTKNNNFFIVFMQGVHYNIKKWAFLRMKEIGC